MAEKYPNRLTISLTEEQHEWLIGTAARAGWPAARLVRGALTAMQLLDTPSHHPEAATPARYAAWLGRMAWLIKLRAGEAGTAPGTGGYHDPWAGLRPGSGEHSYVPADTGKEP